MDLVIKSVAAVTLLLWSALAVILRGRTFEFDTNGTTGAPEFIPFTNRHSFHALFAVYRKVYGGIFIFGSVIPLIAFPLPDSAPFRLMLALSAVYALFAVLWMTFQYESYQHLRYSGNARSPYTGWRYAVTLTLGAMSPILFTIGLLGVVYAR